jgi:hypothetical protein
MLLMPLKFTHTPTTITFLKMIMPTAHLHRLLILGPPRLEARLERKPIRNDVLRIIRAMVLRPLHDGVPIATLVLHAPPVNVADALALLVGLGELQRRVCVAHQPLPDVVEAVRDVVVVDVGGLRDRVAQRLALELDFYHGLEGEG